MAFPHRHLLGIDQLSREDALFLLDEAEPWIAFGRGARKEGVKVLHVGGRNCVRIASVTGYGDMRA